MATPQGWEVGSRGQLGVQEEEERDKGDKGTKRGVVTVTGNMWEADHTVWASQACLK